MGSEYKINSMCVYDTGGKDKQPIILIHGFPFDHSMWERQVKSLKGNYRVITYDIRGLGESYVGDGQYTMEAYVLDLFSIIDELSLKNVIICGLSMGGYIALRAVELNQDIFSALILLSTKSESDDNSSKLNRSEAINKINVDGLFSYLGNSLPNCFSEETTKKPLKIYSEILNISSKFDPLGVKGALLAMLSRTDTTNSLSRIKLPTLVISGSFDVITPPSKMRALSEEITDSEFAITPRAGHLTPVENPQFINSIVKGFLKRRVHPNKN